ncbi:MAG: rhodanese-like domain-containing protein [Candidatus Omnitrophota bacterium]|nr:rhodanese-like domain-containing protein [Candidatus Omnitrophota bacterium]
MTIKVFLLISVVMLICASGFAMCGICGAGSESKGEAKSMFSHVANEALTKNGVREITYEQFMSIRNSGEEYTLFDVLSPDSYDKGHVEGAISFPLDTINKMTAEKRLSKDNHIIVYCGSFQCAASTEAAKKLSGLGYDVLDYKGGLKEWQEKGNKLVSKS